MTEKEIDLFADAEKTSEDVAEQINEKKYQIVDLKNGTFQFKKYNGAGAEQRYTSLGYFKLGEKLMKDSFKDVEVNKRKIEGNKTIRRARSDVFTKLHDVEKMLESNYDFYPASKELLSDAEFKLAQKYCDEINDRYKAEKITAELQAAVVIARDLSGLTHPHKTLTPEQQKIYDHLQVYIKAISYNVK